MATINQMATKYAEFAGIPITRAKNQWTDFCKFLVESLTHGSEVTIAGVGAMKLKKKYGRNYHNPATGDQIYVPEHYVPSMKFTPSIRERIRESVTTIDE